MMLPHLVRFLFTLALGLKNEEAGTESTSCPSQLAYPLRPLWIKCANEGMALLLESNHWGPSADQGRSESDIV